MAGIAKKAFDVARRPENQARIKQAVQRAKQRSGQPKGQATRKPR